MGAPKADNRVPEQMASLRADAAFQPTWALHCCTTEFLLRAVCQLVSPRCALMTQAQQTLLNLSSSQPNSQTVVAYCGIVTGDVELKQSKL